MSFDWKSLVGTVAPTLATVLSGGNPLAGMAVKAIVESLGLPASSGEREVSAALSSATPETLLKLKEANLAFEQRMAELGVDLEKIAADDRASARVMQSTTKAWIVPVLGGVTVAGFFAVVGWVLSGRVSLESTLLGFVLGQVSAKAEQVYNFYFGSSAGSKEKTAHLATKRD